MTLELQSSAFGRCASRGSLVPVSADGEGWDFLVVVVVVTPKAAD